MKIATAATIETMHGVDAGRGARFLLAAARTLIVLLLVAVLGLAGCVTWATPPAPVTVADILAMSGEGVPAEQIIEKMRASGTVYRLKASELADLRAQGVADAVIDTMQQTYLEAVRRDQALRDWRYWNFWYDGYWYGGCPFGWRWRCY